MVIQVTVKTSSKQKSITIIEGIYYISLKSKAFKNAANIELIDTISSYFHTSKSSVKILRGLKSRKKLIEILEYESK